MSSIASFSGLASGVQWRDLVDQIVQLESSRRLSPVQARQAAEKTRLDAWGAYSQHVTKLRDALTSLRDGTAFGAFTTAAGVSPVTGRTLLRATASAAAAPGTYRVEVSELARANKLGGKVEASATTALGYAGTVAINGRKLEILATDSLNQIRDRINALDSGAAPSGVSATILSSGAAAHRLVLTSGATGSAGIELVEDLDGNGTLAQLGLVDAGGARTLNLSETGGTQTHHVSSATAAIATMLGVTMPPPATIRVGGQTIHVDLAVDSLTSIAAKIQALGYTAEVVAEPAAGKGAYRLVTDAMIGAMADPLAADPAASLDASVDALAALGFTKPLRSAVAQVVTSENQFRDGAATATGATTLAALEANGAALGIADGDILAIQGRRGDGTVVSATMTVGAADTLQSVVDRLNQADAFGGAGRAATASIVDGRIVLADSTGGDSQLALSLAVTRADGSVTSLGRMSTSTVGRDREIVRGADAKLSVDGVALTRASNTVADAIAGVSLELQQAEPGAAITVTIGRDTEAIAKAVGEVATKYNELLRFVTESSAPGKPLANNSVVRSAMQSLTRELLADVAGATPGMDRLGFAGLALQRDGTLALDRPVLAAALATSFADVVRLFGSNGTSSTGDLVYLSASEKTAGGSHAVVIDTAAAVPSASGAGFSGTYADDGVEDVLTIADGWSGASGSIALRDGDTTVDIVARLNAMFAARKMRLTAEDVGGQLRIAGTEYGAAAKFTVSYAGGGSDATAQLGLAAGERAGVDVAGSIGGVAATGNGRLLTGAAGSAADGLVIQYLGTATGAVGAMTFVVGAAGALHRAADRIVRTGEGTVAAQQESIQRTITSLAARADTIQQSLDRRRQALVAQFTAMEAAISRIQSQGSALSGIIASLQPRDS